MRKFHRRLDTSQIAYVAGASSLSPEWVEDRSFKQHSASVADPKLMPIFDRARQLGVAFVRVEE